MFTLRAARPALALALGLPVVGLAAGPTLTLQQVEQRYPRMSAIHIEKCDKLNDELFDRGELACVNSIYGAMYLDR